MSNSFLSSLTSRLSLAATNRLKAYLTSTKIINWSGWIRPTMNQWMTQIFCFARDRSLVRRQLTWNWLGCIYRCTPRFVLSRQCCSSFTKTLNYEHIIWFVTFSTFSSFMMWSAEEAKPDQNFLRLWYSHLVNSLQKAMKGTSVNLNGNFNQMHLFQASEYSQNKFASNYRLIKSTENWFE